MDEIKVSVIMPSLNVVTYIEECIESVVSQSLKDIEIICIDAGSTDGTLEVLDKYSEMDARIRVINFGVKSYGAQVNHGISISRGEYIAVLETDDFVHPDMYESLYFAATVGRVDYVKADYKKFFTLNNGEYLFSIIRQFESKDQGFYEEIVNPHMFDELYKTDFNIWRGIYRRDFLIKNQIFMNESTGASYQDIGFMEKVMAAASRAIYLDHAFYHYRVDRDAASSYSKYGLRNTYIEFQKLLEYFAGKNHVYWRGVYLHMMTAFLNEYEKTLKKLNYNFQLPECQDYYGWFVKNISEAIDKEMVSFCDFEKKIEEKLRLLLSDPERFTELSKSDKNKFMEYVTDLAFDECTPIIIFGAGHWGYEAKKILNNKSNCKILAFVDNDTEKQNIIIDGIRVYSLKKAVSQFSTATILIANEKYYSEIRSQIENEDNRIAIICPFE